MLVNLIIIFLFVNKHLLTQ